jgi:hypothetical protein
VTDPSPARIDDEQHREPPGDRASHATRPGPAPLWVLRPVRALAVLAVVGLLLGRGVAPSLPGITVGIDTLVDATARVAALVAQLLAIAATMLAMAQMVTVARSRSVSLMVRLPAVVLGGLTILIALSAAGAPQLPDIYHAVLGTAAATLAVIAGGDTLRLRDARLVALAVGLAGMTSLARLGGVAVAMASLDAPAANLDHWARVLATFAFGFDVALGLVAAAWVATRTRRLASPLLIVCFAIALLVTRAAAASPDDAGAVLVLVARVCSRLVPRPESLVPYEVEVFVAAMAFLLSLAVLVTRGQVVAFAGVIAMALAVRGAAEVPLFGVILVVAALSSILAARDARGMWAALLGRTPRATSGAAPRGPSGARARPPRHAEGRDRRDAEGRDRAHDPG